MKKRIKNRIETTNYVIKYSKLPIKVQVWNPKKKATNYKKEIIKELKKMNKKDIIFWVDYMLRLYSELLGKKEYYF